jgi:hypothetical protein
MATPLGCVVLLAFATRTGDVPSYESPFFGLAYCFSFINGDCLMPLVHMPLHPQGVARLHLLFSSSP